MKEQRFGTLGGLTYPCLAYESVAEADAILPDGILKSANASLAYRGPSNKVRDLVCDVLEKQSGIPRIMLDKAGVPTLVEKDAEEYETAQKYARRVCAAKGWLNEDGGPDLTRFQDEVDALCRKAGKDGAAIAVDIREREPGEPRKPRKISDDLAAKVAKIYDGDKRDAFIGAVKAKIGVALEVTQDREADLKRFAYAALDFDRAIREEAAKAQGALTFA